MNFDELKINPPEGPIQVEKWNGLIENMEKFHLPNVGFGTDNPQAKLHIVNKNEDAHHINGGSSLIIGPADQSNLRLGYDKDYSWIQSHGSKPLAINPLGNNVGIGLTNPSSKLTVKGTIHSTNGGIKFPDGSVQSRASTAINIRSGVIAMNNTSSWRTSPLGSGIGERYYTTPYIRLSGFTLPPYIMHAIYQLDTNGEKNLRLQVIPVNITKTRFRLQFLTWSDSAIYQCRVRWMAIGR